MQAGSASSHSSGMASWRRRRTVSQAYPGGDVVGPDAQPRDARQRARLAARAGERGVVPCLQLLQAFPGRVVSSRQPGQAAGMEQSAPEQAALRMHAAPLACMMVLHGQMPP